MLENIDIKINNQKLSIISEIDEFKGFWKLLDKMASEKLFDMYNCGKTSFSFANTGVRF